MRAVVIWWLVVAALAVSCGSAVRREPSATPADASPTVEASATAVAGAYAEVPPQLADVLRLLFRKDVAGLIERLAFQQRPCVFTGSDTPEPTCLPTEQPGTLVDAFPYVGCGGGFVRGDAVPALMTSLLNAPDVLYDTLQSVFAAPSGGDGAYRVVFQYMTARPLRGYVADVVGERVVAIRPTCDTIDDETAGVADYLIPPYEVRTSGTPPMYPAMPVYMPPPYLRFVVSGTFAGVEDEPGDTDPFLWQAVGASTALLVYWNGGAVYDCGTNDCGSPLSPSEAMAEIKALEPGDEVCIVGWAGDTGHAAAERVYLHRGFVCTAQDVKVGLPPKVDDRTPPVVLGPFRIVPMGYVDPNPVPVTPDPRRAMLTPVEGPGVAMTLEQLRGMPGFSEPSYLPPGYAFETAGAMIAGSDLYSYELAYRGPRGLSIVVGRLLGVRLPYDIERPLPPPAGVSELALGSINGQPAALYRLRPGQMGGTGRIIVVHGTNVTLVVGDVDGDASTGTMTFDELVRVAESIPLPGE